MHIAICGNIGSGKTTLASMLAKQYGWQLELESVDDNPYLKDFYTDMQRWAFHLQVFFLNSRFKQAKKIQSAQHITTIQDRTIYEDAYVFATNLHHSKFISDRDFSNYMSLFEAMTEHTKAPDLLIYLKADIPKLVAQIQKRGRTYESAIRIDYLQNLNALYNQWLKDYSEGKMLTIEVDTIDFVANTEDFSAIINKIEVEINGLF